MSRKRDETTLAGFIERLRGGAGDARGRSTLVRLLQTTTGAARVATRIWRARGRSELAAPDAAALEELVRQLGMLKGIR